MKKKTVISIVSAALILLCCFTAFAVFESAKSPKETVSKTEPQTSAANFRDEQDREGDKRALLDNNPEPEFKANKNQNTKYYDIDKEINKEYLDSVGAVILKKEVIPYGEYSKRFENGEKLTSIDSDRMVWVVQISYPNGYETKVGFFENAVATALYDAETGFYFGSGVKGICKDQYRRR